MGVDARGNRSLIPYTLAWPGVMNQVRRQINSFVRAGRAAELWYLVSARVAQRQTGALSRIQSVQILTGTFDLHEFFTASKDPQTELVRETCQVARRR